MTETEVVKRLERLERDNRRLKRLATVALIIATALGAIYAAQPVPDKMTAHEIDVVDTAGRVRIKLAVSHMEKDSGGHTYEGPNVALYDANGVKREEIGGYLSLFGPQLTMFDDHGNQAVSLDGGNCPPVCLGPSLALEKGNTSAVLSTVGTNLGPQLFLGGVPGKGPTIELWSRTRPNILKGLLGKSQDNTQEKTPLPDVLISDYNDGPAISLTDGQGFSMNLGSSGTVNSRTGETQQTSAASITMFGNDKDHHVIWKAP